jgi:hypothetical protein
MKKQINPVILFLTVGLLWLSTITALGLTTTPTSVPPVAITEKVTKRTNEAIEVNLKTPVLKQAKNITVQKRINKLIQINSDKFLKPLEREAAKYLADTKKNSDLHFNKYSAYTTYKVGYNKNGVLSIPVRYYQYTGGANGLEFQREYNFDLRTGKQLQLSDLFEKGFDYKKVLSAEVLKQMNAHKEIYFEEALKNFKQIDGKHPYYITNGNLVIFYGPFDIAPHAAGIPEFKIPFSKLKFAKTLKF